MGRSAKASKAPKHIWEMLPEETPNSFKYFATYRDFGPDRSIPKTAALHKKSTSIMTQLSADHRWPDRARAYDQHLDAKIRASKLDEIAKMRSRHSDVARDLVAASHSELRALAAKIAKADRELEDLHRLIKKESPEARLPARDTILAPVDIARLVRTGAHLERLTMGEATAVTKIETEFDTSGLTVDELRSLHVLLAKMGVEPDAE